MHELQNWVLGSAASLLILILGFVLKTITAQVLKRLDAIVSELQKLTTNSAVQDQQIKRLQEDGVIINNSLRDHDDRIKTLEVRTNTNINR